LKERRHTRFFENKWDPDNNQNQKDLLDWYQSFSVREPNLEPEVFLSRIAKTVFVDFHKPGIFRNSFPRRRASIERLKAAEERNKLKESKKNSVTEKPAPFIASNASKVQSSGKRKASAEKSNQICEDIPKETQTTTSAARIETDNDQASFISLPSTAQIKPQRKQELINERADEIQKTIIEEIKRLTALLNDKETVALDNSDVSCSHPEETQKCNNIINRLFPKPMNGDSSLPSLDPAFRNLDSISISSNSVIVLFSIK